MNKVREFKWKLLYLIKYLFLASGRSWNDFYGWMLDYQDRKISIEDILKKRGPTDRYKGLWHWEKGNDYFRYMSKHGLKSNHVVFDLGCGYGRCAIPLLRNQTSGGRYIGSEISRRRLSMAEDWITKEKLEGKDYQLVFSKDEQLSFLDDDTVDVTWVLSVFNHMPDKTLEVTIQHLRNKMKKGGLLFAYYCNETTNTESVKFFPRTDIVMTEILEKHGFRAKLMTDWEEEYEPDKRTIGVKMIIGTKE